MPYYVYLTTNFKRTVLYTGLTNDLVRRMEQHKSKTADGFTSKYKADILIYAEPFDDINEARAREKAIKKWNRKWKEELIDNSNPQWNEIII